MINIKILIIGGGLSGLAAAINLKLKGYDPIILEKQNNKKPKLCGGILTNKALKELDLLEIDYKEHLYRPKEIKLFNKNDEILSFKNEKTIYTIERGKLDELLLNKYFELGGTILENKNAVKVNKFKQIVETSNEEIYKYDILIIANGANTNFRRLLNEKPLEKAFCMESRAPKVVEQESINIKFVKNKIGYIWELQNQEEYIKGVGFLGKESQVKETFKEEYPKEKVSGAYVPFGSQPEQCEIKNIYFVGDSGGYVNPLLAEGISYGLASGRAVTDIIEKNDFELDKLLRKDIKSFLRLRGIFYSKFNPIFLKIIKKNKRKSENICKKIVLGENFGKIKLKDILKT